MKIEITTQEREEQVRDAIRLVLETQSLLYKAAQALVVVYDALTENAEAQEPPQDLKEIERMVRARMWKFGPRQKRPTIPVESADADLIAAVTDSDLDVEDYDGEDGAGGKGSSDYGTAMCDDGIYRDEVQS